MCTQKRLRVWAWILLATALSWLGTTSGFAQKSNANLTGNQSSAKSNKPSKNANQPRRQAALDELAAAVDARARKDKQFKIYVDSIAEHNKAVEEFVNKHKG